MTIGAQQRSFQVAVPLAISDITSRQRTVRLAVQDLHTLCHASLYPAASIR
jgi:hypothetical protein